MKNIINFLSNPWVNLVIVLFGYIGIGIFAYLADLDWHSIDGFSVFLGAAICYLVLWELDCLSHIFKSWNSSGSPEDNNKNESE